MTSPIPGDEEKGEAGFVTTIDDAHVTQETANGSPGTCASTSRPSSSATALTLTSLAKVTTEAEAAPAPLGMSMNLVPARPARSPCGH